MNAITITANAQIAPNETFTADEMAKKFNGFARKTAESVLNMAKVVSDMKAQADLTKNKVEFGKFCILIGYESSSSAIRKYIQIGKKFNELMANANKLPNTWTTIYHIALLSNDAICTLVQTGAINPRLSGLNVQEKLGLKTTKSKVVGGAQICSVSNGTEVEFTFRARLLGFPTVEVREKLKRIFMEMNEIDLEVETSPSLEIALNDEPYICEA